MFNDGLIIVTIQYTQKNTNLQKKNIHVILNVWLKV
jgi:hypothetical protein